jgi:hypothetical protein
MAPGENMTPRGIDPLSSLVRAAIVTVVAMLAFCPGAKAQQQFYFSDYAGSTTLSGTDDGTGMAAEFNAPFGVAVDGSGNIYVADTGNDTIREVMPGGVVMTIAGTPTFSGTSDGSEGTALFNSPSGVAVDGSGNIYVADTGNNTIREITAGGTVMTIAGMPMVAGTTDGSGSAALFTAPSGVAVDGSGDIYVADTGNNTIREITSGGMVTTVAGTAQTTGTDDGTGPAAQFNSPSAVAVDGSGNVYIADSGNNTIREMMPGGVVTTLAGNSVLASGTDDGVGTAAQFTNPTGVAVDSNENIYVADSDNSTIREITPGAMVTTIGGTPEAPGVGDGLGGDAQFTSPAGIAVDGSGNIYVSDSNNDYISIGVPQQVTGNVVAISATAAVVSGSANPNGNDATVWFDYGTDTTYGSQSAAQDIGTGTGFVAVTGTLAGLTPGTTYHYRLDFNNSLGTFYGNDQVFLAGPGFTVSAAAVTGTSVTFSGSVNPNGFAGPGYDTGNVNVYWQYGTASGSYPHQTAALEIGTGGSPMPVMLTMSSSGLSPAIYHYQLVISSTVGLTYGPDQVFSLKPPTVANAAPVITGTGATLSPAVNPNGLDTTAYIQYGLTTAYSSGTTAPQDMGSGFTPAVLNANLTGLAINTTYHYQVVATNVRGTVYGLDQVFVTGPTFTTNNALVTGTSVTLSASVNPNGFAGPMSTPGNVYVYWQYGYSAGSYTQQTTSQAIGTGRSPVPVTLEMPSSGLSAAIYHYQLVVSSSAGLTDGPDQVFSLEPPTVTGSAAVITGSGATLSATVNPNGLNTTAYIQYGLTTAYTSGTAASENIGSGLAPVVVNANLTGLAFDTTYHFQVVTTNVLGTVYGPDQVFTTGPSFTVNNAVISSGAVSFSASVNPNGFAGPMYYPTSVLVYWQYGLVAGSYTQQTMQRPIGTGTNAVLISDAISTAGLAPAIYHYQLVVSSTVGLALGPDQVFTEGPPTVAGSGPVTTSTSASLSPMVDPDGQNTIAYIQYGLTTAYTSGTTATQALGSGYAPVAVTANLSGLDVNTTYHYQVVTISTTGTFYSADLTFTTTFPQQYYFANFVGSPGTTGTTDVTGSVLFNNPQGIAVDSSSNIYIADTLNNTIRVVTPAGTSTTLAGSPGVSGTTDGRGSSGLFNSPAGIAVDSDGNIFVADFNNDTIREVAPDGTVTTLAGTAGVSGTSDGNGDALFNGPTGVAVDANDNVFIADSGNDTIRVLTPDGTVTTLAGTPGVSGTSDGPEGNALFNQPAGVAVDANDNVYIADSGNNTIRVLTSSGTVTTLAGTPGVTGSGDGTGNAAQFDAPQGVALDANDNVYIADTLNSTIREMTPAGVVITIGGTPGVPGINDGAGSAAQFDEPFGVAVDVNDNVYVADTLNSRVTIGSLQQVTGEVSAAYEVTVGPVVSGSANPNGTDAMVWFDYGPTTTYGSQTSPQDIGNGTGFVGVTGTLTGTALNVPYHYCLVFSSTAGTFYGGDQVVDAPGFMVGNAAVTGSSVTFNASINPNGSVGAVGDPDNVYIAWQYGPAAGRYDTATDAQPIGTGTSQLAVSDTETGLTPGIYHYQFVVYSAQGTAYGPDQVFSLEPPVVTYPLPATTGTTEILAPIVNPNGLDTTVYIEYGLTTAYTSGTTPAQDIGSGLSPVTLTGIDLTGLTFDTTYHYSVVTTNALGTVYGPDQVFITAPLYTANNPQVSSTSVTLTASVNPNGFAGPAGTPANVYVYWQYGSAAGSYTATTAQEPVGTGTSSVPVAVTMSSGTGGVLGLAIYHYQIVISCTLGNVYGPDQVFVTGPAFTTGAATVSSSSVMLNATINPNGLVGSYINRANLLVSWQYGLSSTSYNLTTVAQPIGTGTSAVAVSYPLALNSLISAVYHYRLLISSSLGNTYGPDQTFSVLRPSLVYSAPVNTGTGATLSLTINPNGYDTTVVIQYGLTTAYSGGTIVIGDIGSGTTPVTVNASLAGLAYSTEYHYRIVTTNSLGTIDDPDQAFATETLFATTAVASTKDSATGIPGAAFVAFGNPAINALGHVAFQAAVSGSSGSGINAANNSGIWADSGTNGRLLVARTGAPAPGYSGTSGTAAGTFATLSDPVYADDDSVAFLGKLVVTGTVTAGNNAGIWATTSGSLALVARVGDPAPDENGAVAADGPVYSALSQFVLPDQGGIVILATLESGVGGVVAGTSHGIWAVGTGGVLTQIIRTGEALNINGIAKTISGITIFNAPTASTGQTRHFNYPGDLTYKLTFTDGSTSIVQSVFP